MLPKLNTSCYLKSMYYNAEKPKIKDVGQRKELLRIQWIPDNANVWRPPAATVAILTPGFNATRQGNAERFSSPDVELSIDCLDDDIRLRFVLSSPPPLPSTLDTNPTEDFDPWERGLTVTALIFIILVRQLNPVSVGHSDNKAKPNYLVLSKTNCVFQGLPYLGLSL